MKVSIRKNEELNGIEVFFDKIPPEEVRTTIKKQFGFRYKRKGSYWYAKDNQKRRDQLQEFFKIDVNATLPPLDSDKGPFEQSLPPTPKSKDDDHILGQAHSVELADFPDLEAAREPESLREEQEEKPKSQFLSVNEQIEKLLAEKANSSSPLSEEERQLLLRFQPAGGKAKQGATGAGLLYEYFTPDEVVRKMWGLAFKHGYTNGDVLEPSCGIGAFLPYVPDSAERTVAYEINPTSAQITSLLHPWAEVNSGPFEKRFFFGANPHLADYGDPEFDLVIGNPPYGSFEGIYAGMGEKRYTKTNRYEEYFVFRGLDLLKSNGLLVYIVPSSFLSGKLNKTKQEIATKATLIDAYRLPNGIFPTTQIGTDIIVLRKK